MLTGSIDWTKQDEKHCSSHWPEK